MHLIIVGQPSLAWPDTPPAAGRAWVPDNRARTFLRSVAPFYDESARPPSPIRDQFVILIGEVVHMQLTTASTRTSCQVRKRRVPPAGGESRGHRTVIGPGGVSRHRSTESLAAYEARHRHSKQNLCNRITTYMGERD